MYIIPFISHCTSRSKTSSPVSPGTSSKHCPNSELCYLYLYIYISQGPTSFSPFLPHFPLLQPQAGGCNARAPCPDEQQVGRADPWQLAPFTSFTPPKARDHFILLKLKNYLIAYTFTK